MGLALGTSTGREGRGKEEMQRGRKRGVGEGLGKENGVICTLSI